METTSALIVVVAESSSDASRLGAVLTTVHYRVLAVGDWQTAAARTAGGGVDLVVLALSPRLPKEDVWNVVAALHGSTAGLPIAVVCDSESKDIKIPRGPSISPALVVPEADLLSSVATLIGARRNEAKQSAREGAGATAGGIIALEGAKGGVGTSTVALNLATLLARQGKTILAEMRPALGTLASQFRIRRQFRTIADLAAGSRAIAAAEVRDCLWHCHQIPGLSILFGPQSLEPQVDWCERAGQVLRAAAEISDHLVIDLPCCFSAVNRAALNLSDRFLVVLERDAACLQACKLLLKALEAEDLLPNSTAAVVVNRVSLAAPVDLLQVERELDLPLIGVIPPDPDLCLLAYQAQTSIVTLDPESMLAVSYARLGESLLGAVQARQGASV
jgi:MinD-like ATPase involved in chromosome partitioning or flagellar assembly